MEKRVGVQKRPQNHVVAAGNPVNTRTLQEIHDEMLATGYPKKTSKFINKNMESAKRAVERYEKDKHVPGAQTFQSSKTMSKSIEKYQRPIKTAKVPDRRYTGYEIPFHAKPIKIH